MCVAERSCGVLSHQVTFRERLAEEEREREEQLRKEEARRSAKRRRV